MNSLENWVDIYVYGILIFRRGKKIIVVRYIEKVGMIICELF